MENSENFEGLNGLENFKGFDNPAYEFEESINRPFKVKSGKKRNNKNFVGNERGQSGASKETPENAHPVDDVWYQTASDEEETLETACPVDDAWYETASDEEDAPENARPVGDEWYETVSASD